MIRLLALGILTACSSVPAAAPAGDASPDAGDVPLTAEMRALQERFDTVFFARREMRFATFEASLANDAFASLTFYSWTQSLAYMFDVTGDDNYALELDRLIDLALRWRDDVRQRNDALTGAPFPSWANTKTAFVGRYNDAGAGALVTVGMAHLYWIHHRRPTLAARTLRSPSELAAAILETTRAFDGPDHMLDGHYLYRRDTAMAPCGPDAVACARVRSYAGQGMAYNVEAFTGLALVYLDQVQHDPAIHARIAGVVDHLMTTADVTDVMTDEGVATVYNRSDARIGRDDVGHMNYEIDFIAGLADYVPALIPDDFPARLARTLGAATVAGPTGDCKTSVCFTTTMDGLGVGDPSVQKACQQIMVLTELSPRLRDVCAILTAEPYATFDSTLAYRLVALRRAQLGD